MKGEQMMKIVQCVKSIDVANIGKNKQLKVGIEIQDFFFTHLYDEGWKERITEYKSLLDGFNEMITFHGPAFDLNPASLDKKILHITRERYYQAIRMASELNAQYIVFHSRYNPMLKDESVKNMIFEREVVFWKQLVKDFQDSDMIFLIENFEDSHSKDIKRLIEAIDSKKVGVCLDIGHVLCNSEDPVVKWIEDLGKHIKYIHLHDNDGQFDQHLPPSGELLRELNEHRGLLCEDFVLALEYPIDDLEKEIKRIKR